MLVEHQLQSCEVHRATEQTIVIAGGASASDLKVGALRRVFGRTTNWPKVYTVDTGGQSLYKDIRTLAFIRHRRCIASTDW